MKAKSIPDEAELSMEFKIVAGALGAVATFAVQKLIRASWKTITGEEPPDPDDPEASTVAAVAWVAASAVGVGVAQVLARRFAANRYASLKSQKKDSKRGDNLGKDIASKVHN